MIPNDCTPGWPSTRGLNGRRYAATSSRRKNKNDFEALEGFNDEDKNGERSHTRGASGLLLLPSPSKPMAVARIFVEECEHDGILTLRYWRAGWWMWKTTHWVEVNDNAVRSVLYRFTEHAVYLEGKTAKPWAPTRRKIGDLLDALVACCSL